jgi:hypothetical protein
MGSPATLFTTIETSGTQKARLIIKAFDAASGGTLLDSIDSGLLTQGTKGQVSVGPFTVPVGSLRIEWIIVGEGTDSTGKVIFDLASITLGSESLTNGDFQNWDTAVGPWYVDPSLSTGEFQATSVKSDSITDREGTGPVTLSKGMKITGFVSITSADSPYDLAIGTPLVLVDPDGANVIINLPLAAEAIGTFITVKSVGSHIGGYVVGLTPNGLETIDGASLNSSIAAQWDFLTIWSDGTQWLILPA